MTANDRAWPRALIGILVAWPFVGLMVAFLMWPSTPTTTRGWVLLFVLGPPAWAAIEWAGSRLFSREMSERISSEPFSLGRILYGVVVLLGFVALYVLAWWLLSLAHFAPRPEL